MASFINLTTDLLYGCRPAWVFVCSICFFFFSNPVIAGNVEVTGDRAMVSAAHPLAVNAGLKVLKEGGTAVDAAIAVQAVLNLVEPQSSGIGGGAFMVVFDKSTGEVTTYDGRETAPMRVSSDYFLTDDGEPRGFSEVVVGGLSVGTPGVVALLARAHADYGNQPWTSLFQDAIELAENGFPVSERLSSMLAGWLGNRLKTFAEAQNYFFPDGNPLSAGQVITNFAFAETLSAIANHGQAAFYQGQVAETIVKTVQSVPDRAGLIDQSDFDSYVVIERQPVCHSYRDYRVCGMGPPSSGAIAIGQILGVLENFNLSALGVDNPISWHLIAEASKLAFADRNQFVADQDFVEVPVDGLLDPNYLKDRASLISTTSALPTPVQHGVPPSYSSAKRSPDLSTGRAGTSHFSIIDEYGNAVSMTTTIEGAFGSQLMVNGFLLNNELTDFSFLSEREGKMIANRIEPGKRPRSSMSPTLVFDSEGSLRLVIGSPGGSRIIGYVVKVLVAVLDWNLPIQDAIDLGNVVNRNGATDLEINSKSVWQIRNGLSKLGHQLRIRRLVSGLYGIEMINGKLRGGADSRRGGVVLGY